MVNTIANALRHTGAAVWFLAPGASVYEALEKMAEKGVGALLVMEEERLVGVISERDYARKVILKGRCPGRRTWPLQYQAARRDRGEGVALHFAVRRD
jgi:CBS domain-containing protein